MSYWCWKSVAAAAAAAIERSDGVSVTMEMAATVHPIAALICAAVCFDAIATVIGFTTSGVHAHAVEPSAVKMSAVAATAASSLCFSIRLSLCAK